MARNGTGSVKTRHDHRNGAADGDGAMLDEQPALADPDNPIALTFRAIDDVKALADKYGGLESIVLVIAEMKRLGIR